MDWVLLNVLPRQVHSVCTICIDGVVGIIQNITQQAKKLKFLQSTYPEVIVWKLPAFQICDKVSRLALLSTCQ